MTVNVKVSRNFYENFTRFIAGRTYPVTDEAAARWHQQGLVEIIKPEYAVVEPRAERAVSRKGKKD